MLVFESDQDDVHATAGDMYLVIEKWESFTHGTVGIMGIPAPESIGSLDFSETPLDLGVWAVFKLVVTGSGCTMPSPNRTKCIE